MNLRKLLLTTGGLTLIIPTAMTVVGCFGNDNPIPYANPDGHFPNGTDSNPKVTFTGDAKSHYDNTNFSDVVKVSTPFASSNPNTAQGWANKIVAKSPNKKFSSEDYKFIENVEKNGVKEAGTISTNGFASFENTSAATQKKDFSTIPKLVQFLKNNNKYINVNDLKLTQIADAAPTTEDKTDMSNGILKFYGELVTLLGPTLTSHLFSKIGFQKTPPSPGVVAQNTFNPGLNSQYITFYGSKFADPKVIQSNYQIGWWGASNIVDVFAHEIGHAISNLLWLTPKSRVYLNGSGLKDPQRLHVNPGANPNNYMPAFFNEQFNVSNAQESFDLANTLVWSNYGRVSAYGKELYPDLFTEGFCQWLFTPTKFQTADWGVLNNFFNNSQSTPVDKNLFEHFMVT